MSMRKEMKDNFVGMTARDIEGLGDRHRKVIDIFSHYNFDRILDVGCGDGNLSVLIKEACKAKKVYGIEISEKGAKLASKNGVKVLNIDINCDVIPVEDEYFDAVYAGGIIEHLFDPDHFLDEVFRVLKTNGIFVIDTPNLASFYNRIALLLGYLPFDMQVSSRYSLGHLVDTYKDPKKENIRASDHIRFFTVNTLRNLLENHQFSLLEIYGSSDSIHVENSLLLSLIKIIDKTIVRIPSLSRVITVISVKEVKFDDCLSKSEV